MKSQRFSTIRSFLFTTLAAAVLCAVVEAGLPTKELLQRVPPGVNAIAAIDVEALLKSDLAQKEKWKSKRDVNYGSRPLMVPPEAKTVLVAAQLNPADDLKQEWEVALIDLATTFPIADVAKVEGGYVDPFDNVQAAWTPSDAYILQLDPQTMAVAHPANRQAIARWIKFAQSNKQVVVSDYLNSALGRMTDKSQFILAVDLADLPQRRRIEERLTSSKTVGGQEEKIKQLTELIAGIQGVVVTVSVTDKINAELRVDFRDDVAPLGKLAKPLILEALDQFDAHIGDLQYFDAELNAKSVVLKGPLSIDGLRRVGSLLEVASTKFSDLQDQKPTDSQSEILAATQGYYNSINKLIEDLRHTLEDTRDNHAVWMERYGRKVDALPILNVDPELVAWGANVAVTFREMGLAKRKAGIKSGVRKSAIYGDYSYGYDGGYYATYTPQQLVKDQINRQEQAEAKAVRYNSWKELEDTRAEMRRNLTLKYGVEF
jgi:hypothetical protein